MSWVISKTEMTRRRELHSLVPSVILTPLATLPASSPQALSFNHLGNELIQFRLKPPDYGGPKRYLYDTVHSLLTSGVERRVPSLLKTGLPLVFKPGYVWAGDAPHPSSLELVWWEHIKPPKMTICQWFIHGAPSPMVPSQCGLNVVNTSMVVSSAAHRSSKTRPRVSIGLSVP